MNDRRRHLWRYWNLVFPFKLDIAIVFVLSLVSAGVIVIQPYLYHYAIDEVAMKTSLTQDQRVVRLAYAFGAMIGFVTLSFASNYYSGLRTTALNYKVTARLRHRLLRHMLRLPLHALVTMKTGGAVARLNQDTTAASQVVNRALVGPGVAVVQIVVAVLMVFGLNWRLSLAAALVIIPMGVVSHRQGRKLRPLFAEIGKLGNELSARATEMFGGVRVARIYRREVAERRGYLKMYHNVIRKTMVVRRKQAATETFTGLSFGLIQVIIISLGVYLIIYNRATVGDIFAIVIYSNRIMMPVDTILQAYQHLQEDFATVDRIFEVFDMEPDKLDRPGATEAPSRVDRVAFRQVGFSYNGNNRKALTGIDLEIAGGSTVALVGRSGAGKSTFIDLLSRFYEPTEGAIYLNGRDLRDIELKSYRRLLGLVQQETFLFDGTVRENIAYAVPRATTHAIDIAATRANAHEFIAKLPRGYDTVIGERGVRLSGGQRQRISMARAFLVDPEILILDEATSNLDTENEQLIQLAMRELLRNRTTFIIAHRLSTVTHADTIVVLDEGRICEIGSHPELLSRQGLYYDMIERQHRADRI
jgi:ATP-binding cassette subfamily B protein/subfamily B ATP-binding cassette protein MsbA